MSTSGSALTLNDLDDVQVGPNYLSDSQLLQRLGDVVLTDIVYTDGVIASAVATWPGGAQGRFTVTAIDETHNKINAYRVSYPNRQRVLVQPAYTRDGTGEITICPDIEFETWTP